MKSDRIFLFLVFFCFSSWNLQAKNYIITDFGAKPDTSSLSTAAIQKAINTCNSNGGGQVIVPAGHFKTGSIILKSNVNLHLESGAILYGSRDLKDYIKLKPKYISLRTQTATIQLIYAENAANVGITGFGEIDGQGSGFKKLSWNDEGITRPHLLRFITCTNVNIENISLKNSGCWMQHFLACEKVRIHGEKVFNRNNFNNDGLDLDGCRNVTVSDFISDSDDDGITLKSTSPKPCENITITNCVVSSRCNAIKMGTESNGGFKNISISNCVVKPSAVDVPGFFGHEGGTSAISLEIVDGGTMEGISISNIQIDGTEAPLFIRLANRARTYKEGVTIDHVGNSGNISISNIRVKNAGKTGCSITGQPGYPVHDIHFNNIVIEQQGGAILDSINPIVEDKPKEYPEATMFGVLPANGFYIHHAKNITFSGLMVKTKEPDLRPVLFLDDVEQAEFDNLQVQSSEGTETNICLKDAHDIIIKNSVMQGKSSYFVKLEGNDSSNLFVLNNLLNVDRVFSPENSAKGIVEEGNVKVSP